MQENNEILTEENDEIAIEQKKRSKLGNIIFFSVVGFIIALLLSFILLNRFVFFKVNIVGSSMYPTFEDGQVITVNSLGTPERGDVVIIANQKNGGDLIIKRVIAVGGDYVEIRTNCYVYVNGQEIKEPYLLEQKSTEVLDGAYLSQLEDLHGGMGRVPEGYIFYLGDNRENSADSRKYGLCKVEDIVGVVDGYANFFNSITGIFSCSRG